MRDFYTEFLAKTGVGSADRQLPILTEVPRPSVNDRRMQLRPVRRVHQWNALDACYDKLQRVRSDDGLASIFDEVCEERIGIMVEGGATEQDAEIYVSGLQFVAEAVMNA